MKIILTTANARYTHCSFGLRCLCQTLISKGHDAGIEEFTIQQSPFDIAERLLALDPDMLGFGVYIWNVDLILRTVSIIKAAAPHIVIVLGGPEMFDEQEGGPLYSVADYSIIGEGETALATLVEQLKAGAKPKQKVLCTEPPPLETLALPYDAYTSEDIANRIVYVESSRGCPFQCAFCLSSRDKKMRYFPLDAFLPAMQRLLDRGVRLFKFTDRTFNVSDERAGQILTFFLNQSTENIQLHFEIMPDRVSRSLLELMSAFPPGMLHLELGVQTFNPDTQSTIQRNQDLAKTMETIGFLRQRTGALLHADLIVGLPGDSEETLATGFDALVGAHVQEIQIGLLKRLKGTPMAGAVGGPLRFAPFAPYEVIQSPLLSFSDIQRLKRLARYFDLYYNSGNFPNALPLLWDTSASPYTAFSALSAFCWERLGRCHAISLARQAERLFDFLCNAGRHEPQQVAEVIERDFRRLPGRCDALKLLND